MDGLREMEISLEWKGKNKKEIRILISFLFGLSLLSLYGPLSATNVSFRSQQSQLDAILMKNDINFPLQS